MTARTWIGGGNNKVSNPKDWSPTGVPQPFDSVDILGPYPSSNTTPVFPTFTMNVSGTDLATIPLFIREANATVNMSHNAIVNAQGGGEGKVTFNLSQESNLNLQQNNYLSPFPRTSTEINIAGSDVLNLDVLSSTAIVNVENNSTWLGGFKLHLNGNLQTTGGVHSVFINDGLSGIDRASAVVALPVLGTGTFIVGGGFSKLTFLSSVGAGQSVSVAPSQGRASDILEIAHPDQFLGSTTLYGGGLAEIDLVGLARADSYTFQNDMLSIFSGTSVIDTLRLHDATPFGFAVEKTSSSVSIAPLLQPTTSHVGLPVHSLV